MLPRDSVVSPLQFVLGKAVRRLELISRLVTHVIQERDVNQLLERFRVLRAAPGFVKAESFTRLVLILPLRLSDVSAVHQLAEKLVNRLLLRFREVI